MRELDKSMLEQIISILKKHDVIHAAVFGTFARGEAVDKSDIDILVELPNTKSLFDLASIKLEMQDELNMDVDVLTCGSINPKIREIVANEKVEIL